MLLDLFPLQQPEVQQPEVVTGTVTFTASTTFAVAGAVTGTDVVESSGINVHRFAPAPPPLITARVMFVAAATFAVTGNVVAGTSRIERQNELLAGLI